MDKEAQANSTAEPSTSSSNQIHLIIYCIDVDKPDKMSEPLAIDVSKKSPICTHIALQ